MKSLSDIVNEYVGLAARDHARNNLQRANPMAQAMYNLLDYHAGAAPAQLGHAPVAFHNGTSIVSMQHQPVDASLAAPLHGTHPGGHPVQQGAGIPHGMMPVPNFQPQGLLQTDGTVLPAPLTTSYQQQQQAEAEKVQSTPGRHAQRKRPPKRRRKLQGALDAAHEDRQASPASQPSPGGPSGYLLDLPVGQEFFEQLVGDENRMTNFATGIANCINKAHGGESALGEGACVLCLKPSAVRACRLIDGGDVCSLALDFGLHASHVCPP